MELSEDRAALLRLVAEGQSYEQVAAVLGIEAEEARERARLALAGLAGGEPLPAEVADALLGHGEREALGPGSAVARDPEVAAAARRSAAALSELAPGAALPKPSRGTRRVSARARIPLFAGIALVALIAVVLAVSGTLGGEESGTEGPGATGEEDEVVISLSPVGGSDARGQARLIRVEDLPVLTLNLRGLEPSGEARTYIVWLYNSPDQAFPVGFRPVGSNGRIRGVVPIPSAAVSLLPEFQALDVSLAVTDRAVRAIRRAERGSGIPAHAGRSVLRGQLRRD